MDNISQIATEIGGIVSKMQVILKASSFDELSNKVEYYLTLNNESKVCLNNSIGKNISLEFSGLIKCIYCQKKTNKSYNQGYCYLCATTLARCDLCIMSPQRCHYHLGTCREPRWGESHCFIPHIVYLANSSGLKVGVSRSNNLLNRWIDQGAIQGLPIITTKSRYQSGIIESIFSKIISDKTNWRKMLSFMVKKIDLIHEREQLLNHCYQDLQNVINKFPVGEIQILKDYDFKNIVEIQYPAYTELNNNLLDNINLTSLNSLIKSKTNFIISDRLLAIKGQYLIFTSGVLNVRSLTGYEVIFK